MVDTGGMQIGQLAAAAATTSRTVRHYHRLGLLDEPQRRKNGYRDYTVNDVVRLMRIRWLANSGIPLNAIHAILARDATRDDGDGTVADLQALIGALEAEQTRLTQRLTKLTSMVSNLENGRPLSALPSEVSDLLVTAMDAAPSPAVRTALERERDLLEVLALSGNAPEELLTFYAASIADADKRSRYSAFLGEWSNLAGRTPESAETDISDLCEQLIGWFEDAGTLTATTQATSPSYEAAAPFSLDDVIPDPAQREVVLRVQRALIAGTQAGGGAR